MPQDLRTYLDQLIASYPHQLKVVDDEVKPEFEATALVDRMEDDPAQFPGFPAVLFKNIAGSSMPLLLRPNSERPRRLTVSQVVRGATAPSIDGSGSSAIGIGSQLPNGEETKSFPE